MIGLMSKLKCLLLLSLLVSPVLAQKLSGRLGNPARPFILNAEILHEGSYELQRKTTIVSPATNWVTLTNFNSFPGTNSFSDTRTNRQVAYRLVRLNVPPAVTSHPNGTTNLVNQEVRLEGAGSGSWPLRFQWLRNGQPVQGATSNRLVFSGRENLSGTYHLLVSNLWGLELSHPAIVKSIDPVATNISGRKIRYVIKGAQGSYIGSGNFETTYHTLGNYFTVGNIVELNDSGFWQYGILNEPATSRILLTSSFVYPNNAIIDLTFTNSAGGKFILQEFDHSGSQFGDFTLID